MKNQFKQFLMALPIGMLLITGCAKEEGCTDSNAENFSATAQVDNSTCSYEGKQVLWYGKTTSDSLIDYGSTSLTYYVDGEIVGSSAANVYWTTGISPDCGQDGSITITKDLGIAKNKSYTYSVKDQDGYIIWEGVLNFTANTCSAIELTW